MEWTPGGSSQDIEDRRDQSGGGGGGGFGFGGLGIGGILIVGLAPAANGGNRTGRIFTGDRSGDWLFASLHRVGLATRSTSTAAGDGQSLVGARMVCAVRCAPPDNKPLPAERITCAPWLERELRLVSSSLRAVVCLGAFGWEAALRGLAAVGYDVPRPRPKFAHAREIVLPGVPRPVTLIASFHPSQHNTFTGRLTEDMMDAVFDRAIEVARAAM